MGHLAALVVFGAAVAAMPAIAAQTVPPPVSIGVTAGKPSELRFTLSAKSAKRGPVVFRVSNRGKLPHDFAIASKKTATIAPGKSATLKIVFSKSGPFVYKCTVPGHAAGGMKGVFRVT